ncbi:MAG: hypothetical protein FWD69_15585 [Polyangiaceae bacterium]|nr:hypothetical protein [Polyangiaceae bacterium]
MRQITHERRAGLVLGIAPGIGFAGASGYPNDVKFIGNPAYFSSSPMLVGQSISYFVMGALTDYVSFGPMVNVATFENAAWKSTGFGIGFRAEVFPLVAIAPTFADTAIYTQLGFGSATLRAKGTSSDTDGSQSFLGVGLHHEFRAFRMLGGHAALGPFIEYDAVIALATERHWLSAGLRVAWYGGAVTGDRR